MEGQLPVTVAFACYLIFMIWIGMYFYGKTRTTGEYFSGGRWLGARADCD